MGLFVAEELKQELQTFLLDELKINLNSEKTKITRSKVLTS